MKLGRTWKHDCSFGDSNFIPDSPKQFDPTNKVLVAQTLWNHCYFSFGCPCGVDNIMEDQGVEEIAGEKKDWRTHIPKECVCLATFTIIICRRRGCGKHKPLVCFHFAETTWIWSEAIPLWCYPAQQGLNDHYIVTMHWWYHAYDDNNIEKMLVPIFDNQQGVGCDRSSLPLQ